MVIALQHLKVYAKKVKGATEISDTPIQCASWNTVVTFADDDLPLDFKPHNRPLFVAGNIKEQKVDYILVDGGSAIKYHDKVHNAQPRHHN